MDAKNQPLPALAGDTAGIDSATSSQWSLLARHPSIIAGGGLLVVMILIGVFGPLFTVDPVDLNQKPRRQISGLAPTFWVATPLPGLFTAHEFLW